MMSGERRRILDEYAVTSRLFAEAVERLRGSTADGEGFIRALAETGTARRACERWRIKLDKHLAEPTSQERLAGTSSHPQI